MGGFLIAAASDFWLGTSSRHHAGRAERVGTPGSTWSSTWLQTRSLGNQQFSANRSIRLAAMASKDPRVRVAVAR